MPHAWEAAYPPPCPLDWYDFRAWLEEHTHETARLARSMTDVLSVYESPLARWLTEQVGETVGVAFDGAWFRVSNPTTKYHLPLWAKAYRLAAFWYAKAMATGLAYIPDLTTMEPEVGVEQLVNVLDSVAVAGLVELDAHYLDWLRGHPIVAQLTPAGPEGECYGDNG